MYDLLLNNTQQTEHRDRKPACYQLSHPCLFVRRDNGNDFGRFHYLCLYSPLYCPVWYCTVLYDAVQCCKALYGPEWSCKVEGSPKINLVLQLQELLINAII